MENRKELNTMKKCLITSVLGLGLALVAADSLIAHGGVYRGPGDVVPPSPGSGSGTSPGGATGPGTGPSSPAGAGPSGPSSSPSGPGTGGGGPSRGSGGGPVTSGGGAGGTDLTPWSFWWEFNKDPYLNLRDSIHSDDIISDSGEYFLGEGLESEANGTLAPTDSQIFNRIIPVLASTLEATEDDDIQSSCLIALAKIGRDTDSVKVLEIFRQYLPDNSQEIQETAALSMGISRREEAVPTLAHLVADDAEGRVLCGDGGDVSDRTRSFAAYALGLIASSTANNDVKRSVFEAVKPILEDTDIADRNIRVAAVNTLALMRPKLTDEKGALLFSDVSEALLTYWGRKLGKSDQVIQSHVPLAIAKLFDEESLGQMSIDEVPGLRDLHSRCREEFLAVLRGRKSDKEANEVIQSAAMALGLMAEPIDIDPNDLKGSVDDQVRLDAQTAQALLEYSRRGTNQQAKFFCQIGMAKQGGLYHRDNLIRIARRTANRVEQGWAAISLGVLAFEAREEGRDVGAATIGEALTELLDAKNDTVLGAASVALGLCGHTAAEDQLLLLLEDKKSIDELAGYVSIGLALMDAGSAQQPLRDLVSISVRRDLRLQQAAIALGKLRDRKASSQLIDIVEQDERPTVQKMAAISAALSFIGDRNTVEPLIRILENESITPLARAFAASALGGVADLEPLPWNSKIGVDLNYRAAVESLTNSVGTGVLDIL
ncbi:MAG: HEAT repeat domain-containing protein [Planctomycetota bacterium]